MSAEREPLDGAKSSKHSIDQVSKASDIRSKRPPLVAFLLRLTTLRRFGRMVILLLIDLVGLGGAIFTALAIKEAVKTSVDFNFVYDLTLKMLPFAYLVTVLLFARSELYSRRGARQGLSSIIANLAAVMVVSLIFALVNGQEFSSYYIFYSSLFFAVLYIGVLRWVWELITGYLLRTAGYIRKILLVGSGAQIQAVGNALQVGTNIGMEIIGYISLTPQHVQGFESLGQLGQLNTILSNNQVDEVIIADSDFPKEQAFELIDQCHQRGVTVRIAPSTMEVLIHKAEFIPGQSVPLFELKPPTFAGFDYLIKRTFDLFFASIAVVILSPLLLFCALVIKLTSKGPVFYKCVRPGVGTIPFNCYKFRTMYQGADQQQTELESENEADGALFKIRQDPRVTKAGRILRRFSIDELPQLFNVLKGDMSLVGPRPLPERDFNRLEDWHLKRYLVLPGITGLWQVSGRSDLDFDDLVKLDFIYLERWSVFLDFVIILKTIPAVVLRRGAY